MGVEVQDGLSNSNDSVKAEDSPDRNCEMDEEIEQTEEGMKSIEEYRNEDQVAPAQKMPVVCVTQIGDENVVNGARTIVERLGGTFHKDYEEEVTHLVCGAVSSKVPE